MGRIREEEEESCSTLSEALLLTSMCIIGLPVEVLIKDGSIFSGIFHTASVHNGYGIALKKARMIKKGAQNPNVLNGGLIDTLVVLPGDLVQVVAKGVMPPSDYGSSCATCDDDGTVYGSVDISRGYGNGALCTVEKINQERQVGVDMTRGKEDVYHSCFEDLKEVRKVDGLNTSLNDTYITPNAHNENHEMMTLSRLSSANIPSVGANHASQLLDKESSSTESVASENSTSSKIESDASRNPLAVPDAKVPSNPLANRVAKESKLNPSAKVFSPSFPSFRSTLPLVQTAPSVAYEPNSFPAVQVAAAQQEIGIRPIVQCQSLPVKFVPYVTSTVMSADYGLQYTQPIAGHSHTHVVARAQPMRHGAQYQPIQATPPYLHQNPQNGIYGRLGQLVYVHPVTHSPTAPTQGPHPLLTSHPIHVGIAKNEGLFAGQAMPVSVNLPPPMAYGPQSLTIPSHTQLSQPLLPSLCPVPIVGSNIPYNVKYP